MGYKKLLYMSLLLLLSVVLLVACTRAADSEIDIIHNVLELQFNGPDETMMKLLHDPAYKTVVDGKEVNEELDQYVAEVYGPYFTESYLDTFFRIFGMHYPSMAHFSGHKLDLKHVVIEKSDKASNRYTFTATVGYKIDGGKEEKTANVSGVVLFSTKEHGKIGKFEYGEDNGLSKVLREAE